MIFDTKIAMINYTITMIETNRLKIYAASKEQMESFIESQTVDVLKAAYTEMLDGCLTHPEQWEWNIPTEILYGEKDNLQSFDTVNDFAEKIGAKVTVMENGEHWFHTDEQMMFLDQWMQSRR